MKCYKVPKAILKTSTDPAADEAVHHVIPLPQIRDLVVESANLDRGAFKERLEELINQDQTRDVLNSAVPNKDKTVLDYTPKADHGKLLLAAALWKPVVRGPVGCARAKDPDFKNDTPKDSYDPKVRGSGIDREIRDHQSTEFQKSSEVFANKDTAAPKPTFNDVVNLPPTSPVPWSKRPEDGKYVVQELQPKSPAKEDL